MTTKQFADDDGLGHVAECYSGQDCVLQFSAGGGDDDTLERVSVPGRSDPQPVWSIMSRTDDEVRLSGDRFAFSIEELSTVDFEDIPSKND